MQSISGISIAQSVVIAMSGIAKVFVGEIVETGISFNSQFINNFPLTTF